MTIGLAVVVVVQFAGLVTLGILLAVTRRRLSGARRRLERHRDDRPHRPRRKGVAPLAIKTVMQTVQTADSMIRRGLDAAIRNPIEELAAWAQVERPDLPRLNADGQTVLIFSDIEGSTALNEQLGDREWMSILDRHNELVRTCVADHRGHVVKNQGDGFMIAFADPEPAVRCCASIQRALQETADHYGGIRVRIGLHVGTSVRRGDDLFGRNVAMAARVADLADGGEILVSEPMRAAVEGLPGVRLGDPRDVELKGLHGVHTVHAVLVEA